MTYLETNIVCSLTINDRVYAGQGSAYDVGKQFLDLLSHIPHKEFKVNLIKPPRFEELTIHEIKILKSSKYAAFLAVHIGLTSYEQLGMEK